MLNIGNGWLHFRIANIWCYYWMKPLRCLFGADFQFLCYVVAVADSWSLRCRSLLCSHEASTCMGVWLAYTLNAVSSWVQYEAIFSIPPNDCSSSVDPSGALGPSYTSNSISLGFSCCINCLLRDCKWHRDSSYCNFTIGFLHQCHGTYFLQKKVSCPFPVTFYFLTKLIHLALIYSALASLWRIPSFQSKYILLACYSYSLTCCVCKLALDWNWYQYVSIPLCTFYVIMLCKPMSEEREFLEFQYCVCRVQFFPLLVSIVISMVYFCRVLSQGRV